MDVEQRNFFQRLRVILQLIWSVLFHRGPRGTETSWSAPANWKSLPRPSGPAPVLGDLLRVIPVVQTHSVADITVTLISLEVYDGGFLLRGQHTAKYGERSPENFWAAIPTFTASDDLGTKYRWWQSRNDDARFTGGFAPRLKPDTRELRLVVTHIQWIFYREKRHELDTGPWEFSVSLT